MTMRESLNQVLDTLPDETIREVLDFATFLSHRAEYEGWQRFGMEQFSRCYGPGEPDYGDADDEAGSIR
jgi:hypothetical protein